VEFHTWNASKTALGRPDRMLLDLDPGEGVLWEQICQAADLARALLEELGLKAWLKTSGGKGLHIIVPLPARYRWDTVRILSRAIAQRLAGTAPTVFVARSGDRNRVGRIFADYLRNGFGATTVTAWSARARPGMGISVPLAWDELSSVGRSDRWSVANADTRLGVGNAPWSDYAPQSLEQAIRAFEHDGRRRPAERGKALVRKQNRNSH
jgi:bifunctional non-homologous end joining protein LigD